MSSTNKTTNYNLSQFVGTDVPSYLGDYNGDMSKIDKAIGDVANSQGSVEQSVVGLTADVQGLSTQVSGVSTSVQQLQTSVAQIDSGYKQADTALSQRITTNANNIQTNTTAIEGINTTIGTEDISGIGDGTIKGAISNINSSLGNLKTYSTEEQIVGTWIDGKPIYRKVVTFSDELTVPCDNWVKTGVNAVNMIVLSAKITSMTGIITAGTFDTPLCYTIDGELAIQTARNGQSVTAKYLIIEYTKTTV